MQIEWKPNSGPQERALQANVFELLYGGARGGGKTEAGIIWLTDDIEHKLYRALVIRRNADDLSDWIDRANRIYSLLGGKMSGKPPIFRFPWGAVIRTGHLKDDQAYTKYQGHEYPRMLIEELTQIPTEKRYLQLLASCRSTIPELKPKTFLTTNPGEVGHAWVKERFIDPAPPNVKFKDPDTGHTRIFIPSTIDDNPALLNNDPGYVHRLEGLKKTDPQLYKAWRWGSWDVFAGQVFREWLREMNGQEYHTVNSFDYKIEDCKKVICFDWGYNAPGCALWLAITPQNKFGVSRVYVYRELYQNKKTPKEWAFDMKALNGNEDIDFMVLPHDCFARPQGGESIDSTFRKELKIKIVKGHTQAKDARLNRIAITHQYLSEAIDGKPYLQTFEPQCPNLIRTLPLLVYDQKGDETKVEDIDTTQEDHTWDALSIGLVAIQMKYRLLSGTVKSARQIKSKAFRELKPGVYTQKDTLDAILEAHMQKGKKKSWKYN